MITPLTLTAILLAAPAGQDASPPAPAPAPAAATPAAVDARPAAQSGLAIVPARLDLGAVARETTIRASAWLVNTTLEPVAIEKADAGCGCTTIDFTPTTLAPGAAQRVWFDIKTPAKVKSKQVKLNFHPAWGERVTLTTTMKTSVDAPAAPAPMESAADAGVLLVPVSRDLGAIADGASVDTSAWLVNAGGAGARVTAIKAGCGCTEVVGFTPTDLAPGTAQRVRLRVTPKAKGQKGPVKTVPLRAIVDGRERPVVARLTMTVHEQVAGGPRR